MRTLLTAALLAMTCAPAVAGKPVDRCAGNASFAAFRDSLARIVDERDAARLLSIAAYDIEVDLGGGAGRAAFVEAWALGTPEESRIWSEMETILRLGCTMEGRSASIPSLFDEATEDERDPYTSLLAIEPGGAVHAGPDDASPVVARLDWDVLRLLDWNGAGEWIPVALADGRRGHVRREHVRSPIDYRAAFERRDGTWRMTMFLAGD